MRKEPDKRISFLCQWQTYQYGTQSPQRYLPLWALLSPYFLYNSDIIPMEVLYEKLSMVDCIMKLDT